MSAAAILAVDLGGTHMRCAAVADDGTVMVRREASTRHDGQGPDALTALMMSVQATVACEAAVVGVPGRVDYLSGVLEYAPNLPQGWVGHIDERHLARTIGVPVALANDADLAAVGEAWFGAGGGYDDVVYITFSTGVGAGVVLARRLLHGRRSLVEIGHTVIDRSLQDGHRDDRPAGPATLEDLASGTALVRAAEAAGLDVHGDGAAVIADVRSGDVRARAVWDDLVSAAAIGILNLAWLFTPQVIVVGGGLGLVGDLLLQPMRDALAARGPQALDAPIVVSPALLGDDAGLVGAVRWAEAFVPESAGRGVTPATAHPEGAPGRRAGPGS